MKQGKRWYTWLKITAKFVYQKKNRNKIYQSRRENLKILRKKTDKYLNFEKKTFIFLKITVEKITKDCPI